MTQETTRKEDLLRNAAIALAVIPLLDNIDESLDKEWNEETFKETDKAMNQFVGDLEKLGFAIVPLTDAETMFSLAGDKLAEVQQGLVARRFPEGPVQ